MCVVRDDDTGFMGVQARPFLLQTLCRWRYTMREPGLTVRDEKRLEKCEERIGKGMHGFVDAGLALAEVNDNHLFVAYGSFAAYCQQRWEITPNYARRIIKAAAVVQSLRGEGCVPIGTLPVTETQARPLTSIPMEEVNGVWQAVVESAPVADGGKPQITAAWVKEKVDEWKALADPTYKPKKNGKPKSEAPDYGKCPNCAGSKWDVDEEGEASCAKCHHPHGAPAGDEPPPNKKLGKQYNRAHWLKQWQQGIGPVVRLVDKIASEVSEKNGRHHKAVQDRLNEATEAMMEWMGA